MARIRIPILLLVVCLVLPLEAQRQRAANRNPRPATWQAPVCSTVSGLPSIRFVKGGVAAGNRDHIVNLAAAAIAASNQPNVLYATYLENLYESRDAGCTWSLRTTIGAIADSGWYIVLARTDVLYVHDRITFAQITGTTVHRTPMPARMMEVFVDPANARHLRGVAFDGIVYDSTDAGESWTMFGDAARYSAYSVAIDPADFNHLVAWTFLDGMMASFDGGRTWTRTGALTNVNTFSIEFSPADSRVVWAVGISPQDGKDRLYRSIDGGMTFAPVLTSVAGLQFSRAELAPHPHNADAIAFSSSNGVALYDHSTGNAFLVSQHHTRAFTWSPAGTLYYSAPDDIVIID